MVTYINYTYWCDHFTKYTNIEWLYCAPETNIVLYFKYTSIEKRKYSINVFIRKHGWVIIIISLIFAAYPSCQPKVLYDDGDPSLALNFFLPSPKGGEKKKKKRKEGRKRKHNFKAVPIPKNILIWGPLCHWPLVGRSGIGWSEEPEDDTIRKSFFDVQCLDAFWTFS